MSITISSRPQEVTVPDFTGQRLSQARSKLAKASLKLGSEDEAPSDMVPKGGIVKQEPAAGTKAKRGSSIRVAVSSGPQEQATAPDASQAPPPAGVSDHQPQSEQDEQALLHRRWRRILILLLLPLLLLGGGIAYALTPPKIPDLVGVASYGQAREIVHDRSLRISDSVESKEPGGTIVAQDPEAGTRAPLDTPISLTVSKELKCDVSKNTSRPASGTQQIPNLTGKTVCEAVEIAGADFEIIVDTTAKSSMPEGTIVIQNPQPDGQLAKVTGQLTGSSPFSQPREGEILISLSGGEESVKVPDVSGMDSLQAASTLIEEGLTPQLDGEFADLRIGRSGEPEALIVGGEEVAPKTIIATDSAAGEMVDPGRGINMKTR